MNKIKAVIFDVGGVLALGKSPPIYRKGKYHSLGVHEYVAKKLKISIDQYFDSIDTAYAKSVEGRFSKKQVLDLFAKNFRRSPIKLKKIYKRALNENFKQNKQLFKQAFKLKKLGYKIAVLSDQWHLSKEILMPDKLYKKFDVVIVSCDVKMRKPNPKIYKLTLKKLKLKPFECVFIDNKKWNTEPAKKLGINTILFKDNEQLFKNKMWRGLFR